MTDINLHFTGDFAAIGAANNLLAALIDNHIHQGNALGIDPRTITWKRVVDLNDRALRDIVVGLGGVANGFPREDGFDIVVASEVMAIFCLAESLADLKKRLGDIVIGYNRDKQPVTARDLKAHGAMTVLLRDAFAPNLVQTLEHTPAMIHGGPFANIAHGCNSVIATRTALQAGRLRRDRGGLRRRPRCGEVHRHQVPRLSGLRPSAVVVVATIRALKYHGGVAVADLKTENVEALTAGMANLRAPPAQHPRRLRLPVVVAINRFPTDTDLEVKTLVDLVAKEGVAARSRPPTSPTAGAGAEAWPTAVLEAIEADDAEDRLLLRLPRRDAAGRQGRGSRDLGLRRRRRQSWDGQGQAPAGSDRGGGLRPPAGLHGQDAVLLLHRPGARSARRPVTPSTCARCGSRPAPASWCSSPET